MCVSQASQLPAIPLPLSYLPSIEKLMKTIIPFAAVALTWLACFSATTHAAGEPVLSRLATCQDTWSGWQEGDPRMDRYVAFFENGYTRDDDAASFTPKAPTTSMGFSVTNVFPQSVGMGVGFSVTLVGGYAQIQMAVESELKQPMDCSTSDGMKSCVVGLAADRIVMLTSADNGAAPSSLLGCFYRYDM